MGILRGMLDLFRIDWSYRKKVLKKTVKHANILAIDFRGKAIAAQNLAHKLQLLELEQKATADDVRETEKLIQTLQSFAGNLVNLIVFIKSIQPIVASIEKSYGDAKGAKRETKLLKARVKIARNRLKVAERVVREELKMKRKSKGVDSKLLELQIKNTKAMYARVKDELENTQKELKSAQELWAGSTKRYESYEAQFEKEGKAIKKLLKETGQHMKTYLASVERFKALPGFGRFIEELHTKSTRKELKKLAKWLARYTWYYF